MDTDNPNEIPERLIFILLFLQKRINHLQIIVISISFLFFLFIFWKETETKLYAHNERIQWKLTRLIYTVTVSNLYSNSFHFQIKFQASSYLLGLCWTKNKVKKTTERNGKNYWLDGIFRRKFLDRKTKTRGIVLSILSELLLCWHKHQ